MNSKNKRNSKSNENENANKRMKKTEKKQNLLLICLECGQYLVGDFRLEGHKCGKENLNNFTECMDILKSKAVKIIESHGLSTSLKSVSSTSIMSSPPPPPPPSNTIETQAEPAVSYIDELKKVLKERNARASRGASNGASSSGTPNSGTSSGTSSGYKQK